MWGQIPLRIAVADLLARASMKFDPLERLLSKATHSPRLRSYLHVGAVAHSYSRVLTHPELRIADFGRYRLYVNVAEPLGVQAFFFGDPGTLWFARHIVRSGDVFLDLGANAGHWAFALSSVVGPRGRVVAAEANPAMAALIERSVALNGFDELLSVERRALWRSSGETMRFMISTNPSNTGTSSLVDHGVYVTPEVAVEVTTIALDDLVRERDIDRVRLVKLDVERAEHEVLQGARRLLSEERIDYLIVEMHAGSPAQNLLEEYGYFGRLIDASQKRLLSPASVPPNQFGDFLFASPSVARTSGFDQYEEFAR